jgi:hypothetical protein
VRDYTGDVIERETVVWGRVSFFKEGGGCFNIGD